MTEPEIQSQCSADAIPDQSVTINKKSLKKLINSLSLSVELLQRSVGSAGSEDGVEAEGCGKSKSTYGLVTRKQFVTFGINEIERSTSKIIQNIMKRKPNATAFNMSDRDSDASDGVLVLDLSPQTLEKIQVISQAEIKCQEDIDVASFDIKFETTRY